MRLLARLVLLALVAAPAGRAQTVPAQGTEATFDIASWNAVWFGNPTQGPSNDALQRQNVGAVVRQAGIDLWAMQEIANPSAWVSLLVDLQPEGLLGLLGPPVSSDASADQRLAYIYDPDVVTIIAQRTLPASVVTAFNFGGRAPFELLASVQVGGVTRSVRIINLHAKALTTLADYNRRLAGSIELKAYTDELVAQGTAVIVLGDLNDRLNQSTVSGQLSPYRNFALDTQDYDIPTRVLDQTNAPTFCSNNTCTSGSPIDHIIHSSALFPDYVASSGRRFIELATAITNYRSTTSDHLPVLARYTLLPVAGTPAPDATEGLALRPAAPSPFTGRTAIRFHLDAPAQVRLEVSDALGRRVHLVEAGFGAGEQRVVLEGAALAPGVYHVRVEAAGRVQTQRIVRAR